MFKWFSPSEFMNTYEEFHAAVEGFCDGFLFIIPWLRNKYKPSKQLALDICSEHHYYAPGVVFGLICFVLFCAGVYELVV